MTEQTTLPASAIPLDGAVRRCQWDLDKDSDLHNGGPSICGKPAKFRGVLGPLVCGTHRRTIDCNNAKYGRPERCEKLTPNA